MSELGDPGSIDRSAVEELEARAEAAEAVAEARAVDRDRWFSEYTKEHARVKAAEASSSSRPRAAGRLRVVSVDVRYFDGALLTSPTMRVADDVQAVYVDGRLDRIEWEHVRDDGLVERHLAPVSNVSRLWAIGLAASELIEGSEVGELVEGSEVDE